MKRKTFITAVGKGSLAAILPNLLESASCNHVHQTKQAPSFIVNGALPAHFFFPDDNIWNTPIQAGAPVDPRSDILLANHGANQTQPADYTDYVRVECAMP